MASGKLPNEILKKLLTEIPIIKRDDVLIGAKVGVDTAHVLFDKEICVLSTDPVTGATDNAGAIAVTIAINDIATAGAEPVGLLLTILAPDGTTHEEIEAIQRDATETSNALGVQIIGGHTEITAVVNQTVLSVAAIGKLPPEQWMDIKKIQEGDRIAVSKSLGLEGSAILAADREAMLKGVLTSAELDEAKGYISQLSVMKEGRLGALLSVQYMHDITEGGLLGALYETAQAIKKGVCVNEEALPITPTTQKIATAFSIDPLRLISSGSMLLVIPQEKQKEAERLFEEEGIALTFIGEVCKEGVQIVNEKGAVDVPPPEKDMLYTALRRTEPQRLILATDNPDKAVELRHLLDDLPLRVLTKKEAGIRIDVEEDGRNLEENALLKARAVKDQASDAWVIADDTGLFVQALGGEPGIHAARYAGPGCSYEDNCNKMLREMEGQTDRTAYFATCVALLSPDGSAHIFFGQADGQIRQEPKGTRGFGYDALFVPDGYTETFAEMEEAEKNAISHRQKALVKAKQFLARQ